MDVDWWHGLFDTQTGLAAGVSSLFTKRGDNLTRGRSKAWLLRILREVTWSQIGYARKTKDRAAPDRRGSSVYQ